MSNEQQPNQDAPQEEQQVEVQAEETIAEAPDAEVLSEEQQRIIELEKELAKAQQTIEDQKDGVLRARAEMENARRRAETEVEKARKYALEKFAGELLPVLDNLERAIQMADRDNEALAPMIEGVELTLKSFVGTVEKFGIKVIDPQGETFNPEQHQAMSMQESADVAPNTVIAVMQKGFELNGRLLRPAMVMVSRAASDSVDTQA